MTILLDLQSLEKSYGPRHLFRNLSFGLMAGDHLGLIGRNGTGKSTLMKIIAGLETPDSGQLVRKNHLSAAYVAQSDSFLEQDSVGQTLLKSPNLSKLGELDRETTVAKIASQMGLGELDRSIGDLSGGWRKRVAVAESLLVEPDLLLLDEPTNHLDIDNTLWLEGLLKRARFSWILVSHDRTFLENTVNKVAELSPRYPDGIFFGDGGYQSFLVHRDAYIQQQQSEAASLANRVRGENAWLARGPKARSTKAKARIQQAGEMNADLSDLQSRLRQDEHRFDFSSSERKTKKLIELEHGEFSYQGDAKVFGPWNLLVHNGMRIGILGRNGTGKTTLMKVLTKHLDLAVGSVRHADGLQVVYFDQKRASVDTTLTLKQALSDQGDQVIYQGKPVHVNSWAKKFLFQSDQLDTPLSQLSGGEVAKVHLARLMLQPADVLALDEPTNDLDMDALETLEESLCSFAGAVLVISHDRSMLESVCTDFIGLNQQGVMQSYRHFDHWLEENPDLNSTSNKKATSASPNQGKAKTTSDKSKRLSYLEQREFDGMEKAIEHAEAELDQAKSSLEDPEIASKAAALQEAAAEFERSQAALDKLYARWAELEAKVT